MVRTRRGEDDRASGGLWWVLLHDGRGMLDGEEAAVHRQRVNDCLSMRSGRARLWALPPALRSRESPAVPAHLSTLTRMISMTASSSSCSSEKLRPVMPALAKKKSRRPCSFRARSLVDSTRDASAASPVKAVTCGVGGTLNHELR